MKKMILTLLFSGIGYSLTHARPLLADGCSLLFNPDRPLISLFLSSFTKIEIEQKDLIMIAFFLLLLLVLITWGIIRLYIFLQGQKQRNREYLLLAQYRKLVDNMPVIYIRRQLLNTPTGLAGDFIFRDINTEFEKVFDCQRSQVVGRRLGELLSGFEKLECLVGIPQDKGEFVVAGKNGLRHYDKLSFRSSEDGCEDVFCIDRTEEHQALAKMEEHRKGLLGLNEKYKIVLRATGLTPWVWDLKEKLIDCDIEYTSGVDEAGDKRLVVTDEVYYSLIHPENREQIRNAYVELLGGRTEILQQEYKVIYLPGEDKYRWTKSFAMVSERDAQGQPTLLVGASVQIDVQKKLEQDLWMAKEKAEESNRLKTAFLANMSHEIRTPLNAIVGFSNVLAGTDDESERQEYLSIIEKNNALLLQLVGDILDLSKIEAGVLEFVESEVDLRRMFSEVVQSTKLRLQGNSVQIEAVLPDGDFRLQTDPNRLMQVVMNLVTNALKFTTEGSIRLGFRTEENGMLRFYVTDSGCGISDENQKLIFRRFVKLDSFAQGTGLGLSICEAIVTRFGGQIGVESESGKGSTFWFTHPCKLIAG